VTAWPITWPTRPLPRSGTASARLAGVATPRGMALVAVVIYGAFALAAASLHGTESFAKVAPWVTRQSHASPTIDAHLHANDRFGYDGEFFLAIALDPSKARYYMDKPAYRYGRIGYPMLARAVALGQDAWIPAALILINLLAVGAGTFCVATLLARKGSSPALAAFYFLFPGLFMAFLNDLSEPLAYGLVALGLVLLDDWRQPKRVPLAGAVFALAALTRETTLLIPLALAAIQLVYALRRGGSIRRPVAIAAIAALPYAAWIVVVHLWLGSQGGVPVLQTDLIPFSGLGHASDAWPLIAVALPAVVLLVALLIHLASGPRTALLATLVLSLILFAIYLPPLTYNGYISAGRLQIGAVLLVLASVKTLARTKLARPFTGVAVFFAYLPLIPILAVMARTGFLPVG
jgi:hypothetical protein